MSSFASKKGLPQGAVPAIAEPIVRGVVLVKDLENGGAGIAGFVKGWERLIHGHSNGSFSAMFTHFAWLLQTQSGQTYILERGNEEVTLSPEEDEQEYADFVATISWEPPSEGHVDGTVLNDFVAQEKKLTYDLVTKNCKHLVYDFYTQCLQPGCNEEFGHFCQRAETIYRAA